MNILSFTEQFYLHDSSIENIGYEFFKDQFVITVNLCNWLQPYFKEGDPEHIIGNFIFKEVSELEKDPKDFILYSNQILEVNYEPIMRDIGKISFAVMIFEPNRIYGTGHPVVLLSFTAKEVEWFPLDSYFDK